MDTLRLFVAPFMQNEVEMKSDSSLKGLGELENTVHANWNNCTITATTQGGQFPAFVCDIEYIEAKYIEVFTFAVSNKIWTLDVNNQRWERRSRRRSCDTPGYCTCSCCGEVAISLFPLSRVRPCEANLKLTNRPSGDVWLHQVAEQVSAHKRLTDRVGK